jgi:hypothetical protein
MVDREKKRYFFGKCTKIGMCAITTWQVSKNQRKAAKNLPASENVVRLCRALLGRQPPVADVQIRVPASRHGAVAASLCGENFALYSSHVVPKRFC